MKLIHFFALRGDILPVLEMVESKGPLLKYVLLHQISQNGSYQSFAQGAEIPNLGRATSESAINSETFLVCERDALVKLEHTKSTGRFYIDQLSNPDTVTFSAGGIWKDKIVLYGRVATISDSGPSQALMRRYHSAIKKHFSRIKAFYVGPEALTLLRGGARLTIAEQSAREFDLTEDRLVS